jgi:cytochrome c-type biogenesis protein CcmH/NrfG
MANRFCSKCGAPLIEEARFCVGCGTSLSGGGTTESRPSVGIPMQRYAPILVVSAVVVLAAIIVIVGLQSPKTRPPVPSGQAPPAAGELPPDHPPLGVPEEVKQTIRKLAAEAQAAPDDLELWKRVAEVQYRASRVEPSYAADAEKSYQHILERQPNDPDTLRALGNIAYDREQPKVAIDFYNRYLEQRPDDLNVRTDLGTMHLSSGEGEEAIRIFQEVLEKDPSFFQAQFNLAIAYHSAGRLDEAVAGFEKARDVAPDEPTRQRVEQLIARTTASAPGAAAAPPAAAAPAPAAAAAPPASGFQAEVEGLFRSNPVMGPKVARFEWTDAASARVFLRDFPMDRMGEEMRNMFIDRMIGRLQEKKTAFNVADRVQVDLVDAGTGKVMGNVAD